MSFVLADAYGLVSLANAIHPEKRPDAWPELTSLVENGELRFCREVVEEVQTLARDEQVAAWCGGLGGHIAEHRADIAFMRPLMSAVSTLGFPKGFGSLDGKEPSIAAVGRLALSYQHAKAEFAVMSSDVRAHPLRPSLSQMSAHFGWKLVDIEEACRILSVDDLLVP